MGCIGSSSPIPSYFQEVAARQSGPHGQLHGQFFLDAGIGCFFCVTFHTVATLRDRMTRLATVCLVWPRSTSLPALPCATAMRAISNRCEGGLAQRCWREDPNGTWRTVSEQRFAGPCVAAERRWPERLTSRRWALGSSGDLRFVLPERITRSVLRTLHKSRRILRDRRPCL